MKSISPALHGVLDYTTAAVLVLLAGRLNLPRRVGRLLQLSALFTVLYSLFTRYRFGLIKVLPMQVHLGLDLISAVLLYTGPEWLPVRDTRSRRLLRALGAFEMVVPLLTRTEPEPARSDGSGLSSR